MTRPGTLLLLFYALTTSCDTDEAEFPVLFTMEAQQIGANSVVLEASIKEVGSKKPIQYGFLWSITPGINLFNAADKVDLGMTSERRSYSIKLDALDADTQYFVRAFVANPDYATIHYGNEISFTTLK